jgi:hypothetical protein
MQEFESISASSYDPSALATKLTAKAAEGWSVVAIVPTGGDVTAYISRDRDGESAPKKDAEVVEKDAAPAAVVEPEPAKPEPEPVKIEAESKPATEPSGWAMAPEPAAPTAEPAAQPAAVEPTTTYQPSLTPSSAASTPAATGPATGPTAVAPAAAAAAVPAAAAPAAAAPAAAAPPTPAVPAGWYADPAGRFELRYWDGSTWTEHVSRTGQQFTDPPVA